MKEHPGFAPIFEKAGVTGTFAMLDPVTNVIHVHNLERAQKGYVPASTFKLANSVIGLDCGAIASVDEVLPYGGKPQPIAAWEKDMSLRDAIKVSNVPVYQELARRIGLERMKAGVKK
ncbi:MAG: penicillin-binding transpeptidase domain-containing protein, partial [Chthoniobacteraceae bacterium]